MSRTRHRRALTLGACCAILAALPGVAGAQAPVATEASMHAVSLVQCVSAPAASGRTITFMAEIRALAGARMWIQINLQERLPGGRFKQVKGPGVGLPREAAAGVAAFQSVRTLSNLTAPAAYRAQVTFRWTEGRRTVRRESDYSPICRMQVPVVRAHHATSTPAAPR